MRISRVEIHNFRSVKNLVLYPRGICGLVGENNAGKTNILSAIDFLLGERWPSKNRLEPTDYYDISEPIHISIEFEDNPDNLSCVWCTMPWDDRGETKRMYAGNPKEYYLNNATRESCALVYLDANRNLDYHLGHSRWTLFGRIIRQLDEDFRATAPDEQQEELVASFERARELLQTDLYRDFEQTIRQAFSEQLKRTDHEITLEFQTFDPINYYRSIHPLLRERGRTTNPGQTGQGMRNLLLLAFFRAYAQVFRGDAIIAVEEPEIYLHPHAQRSLYSLFTELAERGNQVFYTTHSGSFVAIDQFDQIALVEKDRDDDNDVCTHVRQIWPSKMIRIRQQLHPNTEMNEIGLRERYRNISSLEHSEAFFAKKILLVEGETEEYAFPIFSDALGYNFDANGISVVNAGGKTNLDQFYQLYAAFNIPVYVVYDNDRDGNDNDLRWNEILLEMLGDPPKRVPDGRVEETYAVLEGDFEAEMRRFLEGVEPGYYDRLRTRAAESLGAKAGKGLVARFMAQELTADEDIPAALVPPFIGEIVVALRSLGESPPPESTTEELTRDDAATEA